MCYTYHMIRFTQYHSTKDVQSCQGTSSTKLFLKGESSSLETTNLAHAVDIAGEKAQLDTEVKNVLSDKYILAWILSRVAIEFRGMPIQTIVQCIEDEPLISRVYVNPGKTNESIIGRDTDDKVPKEGEARFDILFHVITPSKERLKIIINVEAQKSFNPGYDLVTRGIYYGARLISSQKEKEFNMEIIPNHPDTTL